jgi:hypothetical protein
MPAQNAVPAPVSTIARTRFSKCKSARASESCAIIERVSALRRSGRLSTIVPTAPDIFTSIALLDINISKHLSRKWPRRAKSVDRC